VKVLVTGATGFVGSRIVAELNAAGHEIVAVGSPRQRGDEVFAADIASAQSLEKLHSVGQVDTVIHTAGLAHRFGNINESDYRQVNVDGVTNVATLAVTLGAKHLVVFSSTLVYGRHSEKGDAITEDAECRPADDYGRSKLCGEIAAKVVCSQNNIELTILRPSPIVGEGGKGNFNRLIKAIDKRMFVMVGDGENLKSLIYVGDVAKAAVKVIEQKGNSAQIYNLVGGEMRVIDIVKTVESSLGRTLLPIKIPAKPLKLMLHHAPKMIFPRQLKSISIALETWLSDDVYSSSKLRSTYDFVPETSIEQAISLETGFYLNNK
jgi:nucleoside-diphosphate-sugar epimerase